MAQANSKKRPLRQQYPKEYRTWGSMRTRCRNPNHSSYPNYGGRGISVCGRWELSFENFFADMGPAPTPLHSIDRIDNNRGYWCGKCPECRDLSHPANCRWATLEEQYLNRRTWADRKRHPSPMGERRFRGLRYNGWFRAALSRKRKQPQLYCHATGQGRIVVGGRSYYLGKYGSADTQARFEEIVGLWKQIRGLKIGITPPASHVNIQILPP